MKKFLGLLLTVLTCLALVACAPNSVADAKEKMKEAGYTVVAYNNDTAEGLQGGFVATSGLIGGNSMTALYFETKEDAKNFFESLENKENGAQSGNWVYWGDEAAIKAFKK